MKTKDKSIFREYFSEFVKNHLVHSDNSCLRRIEIYGIFKCYCETKYPSVQFACHYSSVFRAIIMDSEFLNSELLSSDRFYTYSVSVVGFEYDPNLVQRNIAEIRSYERQKPSSVRKKKKSLGDDIPEELLGSDITSRQVYKMFFDHFIDSMKPSNDFSKVFTVESLYEFYGLWIKHTFPNSEKYKYTFNTFRNSFGYVLRKLEKNLGDGYIIHSFQNKIYMFIDFPCLPELSEQCKIKNPLDRDPEYLFGGKKKMVKRSEAQNVFNDFTQCIKPGGDNTFTRMQLYGIYEQFNDIMSEVPSDTKYHRNTFNQKLEKLDIPCDCVTKITTYRGFDREYKEYLYHCDIINFSYNKDLLVNSIAMYREENIMSKFKKNASKILDNLKKNGPVKIIQPAVQLQQPDPNFQQGKVDLQPLYPTPVPVVSDTESANDLYSKVRKYGDFHAKGDNNSVFQFMEDENYSRSFSKDEYMQFKKLYVAYLKYCNKKGYLPISRVGFKSIMEDHTYAIEKRGGTLFINVNKITPVEVGKEVVVDSAKPEVVEQVEEENKDMENEKAVEILGSVKVFNFKFKPIETPDVSKERLQEIDHFVRDSFIRKYTQYSEDGKATYDTKKLYASFKYYTKDKDITFNQLRYVLSHIPAARLTTSEDFTKEFSALIPEFYFLAHIHDKDVENGIPITVDRYNTRVLKAKAEVIKIYKELKENNGFDDPEVMEEPVVEEIKKEEEVVVPVQQELLHEVKEEPNVNKEIQNKEEVTDTVPYETDNEAFSSINSAMESIEHDYAGVIRKYKALESIKQVIKEERVKVHVDLKPIFDMLVNNALTKFEDMNPTFPSFDEEVEDLKANLRNLSSFVKKA